MKYVHRVLTVQPQATKIRTSEEELIDEMKIKMLKYETRFSARIQKIFASVRVFLMGKSMGYVKPEFTAVDCFFIMLHLQIHLRFMVNYTDLTLEWGGFLVWVVFTLMNILICSGLAFMYTFFGDYGCRSFLTVWDICPFFQGIAICMFIWEIIKLMETGLILSSGILSIPLFFELMNESNAPGPNITTCASPDRFAYKSAYGVPRGISEKFTLLGYNLESNSYSNWTYDAMRGQYLGLVWFVVIVIRIVQYKRYRIFPVRIMPVALALFWGLILGAAALHNLNPAVAIVYSNKYSDVFAYLQIFAFCISDYLPSHWITIGYLHPNISTSALIWRISFLKIITGFVLYLSIPYFADNFREYVNCTNDNCLYMFGIHFFFVVIPVSISKLTVKYVDVMVYGVYMILMFLNAVCYILLNLEMIQVTLNLASPLIYRFRNMVYITACLFVYSLSQLLCVNTVHYALYEMNFRSHYYSEGILLVLSMLGIAIYGLEKINADHHFFFGCAYQHLRSTKLLLVVCTVLVLIYVLDSAIFLSFRDEVDNIYWIILFVTLLPFTFGIINTLGHKKSYHGIFQPLTTWGRPQPLVRTGRRRRDLRKMFIYRTKSICNHYCLLNHPVLAEHVEEEYKIRRQVLGEMLDYKNLLVDWERCSSNIKKSSFRRTGHFSQNIAN